MQWWYLQYKTNYLNHWLLSLIYQGIKISWLVILLLGIISYRQSGSRPKPSRKISIDALMEWFDTLGTIQLRQVMITSTFITNYAVTFTQIAFVQKLWGSFRPLCCIIIVEWCNSQHVFNLCGGLVIKDKYCTFKSYLDNENRQYTVSMIKILWYVSF